MKNALVNASFGRLNLMITLKVSVINDVGVPGLVKTLFFKNEQWNR